jgi:hypothetical protein
MVFITMNPDRYYDPSVPFYCSGTLVTRRDILASDHCLKNRVPEDIQINAGSFDLLQTDIYSVLWWVTYETWAMHRSMRIQNPGETLLTIIRVN